MKPAHHLLGSTGGSGSLYTLRTIFHLLKLEGRTTWVPSVNFFRVLKQETGLSRDDLFKGGLSNSLGEYFGQSAGPVKHEIDIADYRDIGHSAASGSAMYAGMLVMPCSMKTLASVAAGITNNLIERAADVCLKERRKLILVPRETPYHLIHIENMRTLTLSGAVIMPASPGFYHNPQSIIDLYDFMVARAFQHLGIEQNVMQPYKGDSESGFSE